MRVSALAAAAALAVSVACNNVPTGPNIISSSGNLVSFISSVQTTVQPAITATSKGGAVTTVSGGPTVTVTGPTNAVDSGANLYSLHGSSAFTHVFVFLGSTGGTVAATGFYEVDSATPITDIQLLVTFGAAVPTKSFDLQFQVSDANQASAGPATITTALTSDLTTIFPSVVASYNPSPAPFLAGANCALSTTKGCLWEFSIILQETNGISVSGATMTETFTFGTSVTTNTLNVTIPPKGIATITRNFACGTGGTACATPAQLAGGTYTYTITGTDLNGNAFTFNGPVLVLSHQ
jgi:hypothetical protein